jgi:hypothetical protein
MLMGILLLRTEELHLNITLHVALLYGRQTNQIQNKYTDITVLTFVYYSV